MTEEEKQRLELIYGIWLDLENPKLTTKEAFHLAASLRDVAPYEKQIDSVRVGHPRYHMPHELLVKIPTEFADKYAQAVYEFELKLEEIGEELLKYAHNLLNC
ncbi:hypothetical protein [Streptococcus sp. S784/96/1]|uniref:hypothetical protein n=1 Tax=Streptococcus sp. S784/96/1 TaxID=2653499 RepID=UPI0013868248|nr:hypothetical protein [Streptococcus sp. S784/96/1]